MLSALRTTGRLRLAFGGLTRPAVGGVQGDSLALLEMCNMLREAGKASEAAHLLLEAGVAEGSTSAAAGVVPEAAQLELAVCYLQMGELEAAKAVAGETARAAKVCMPCLSLLLDLGPSWSLHTCSKPVALWLAAALR
jgi:hypothetical protein